MWTAKLTLLLILSACLWAQTAATSSKKEVEGVYPEAQALYLDLHRNPELSSRETQTAAKLAARLRNLWDDATEPVGGTAMVATLMTDTGPSLILRPQPPTP